MTNNLKYSLIFFSSLLALGLILVAGFFVSVLRPYGGKGGSAHFIIKKGESVQEIGAHLSEQKLLRNQRVFKVYARLRGLDKKFLAGEHVIPRPFSIKDLVETLSSGVYLEKGQNITIIEGWGLREIESYLKENSLILAQEFFQAAAKDFAQEFPFLKERPLGVSLEGYLFPDTYRIPKPAAPEDILRAMLKNFSQKFPFEFQEIFTKQGQTIFSIITMASIVEREVPFSYDRPLVAGILWKRLKVGMPLQVDSTVNYATNGKSRALSSEELALYSPYNTYKYPGLPPTPISNPGLNAISAAIFPKESPYWYFLSKEDGTTVFSKTLKEHIIAKNKWVR